MVFFLSRIFWSALLPVSVGQCQWQTSGNSYEFSCAWRLWGYSSHTPVSTETWWPGESQKQIWIVCIPVPKCSFLWAFLSWCEAACAGKEKSAGGSGADGCHQFTAALQFWHQLRVSMWQHQVWQSEWLLCPSKFSCLVISSSTGGNWGQERWSSQPQRDQIGTGSGWGAPGDRPRLLAVPF